ncbi:MAG TPA: hypothetical protein VEB86_09165, partial [Chryseosolibacter sp.]|nr:hypothetical protein [Chryseosolibacter sp.]
MEIFPHTGIGHLKFDDGIEEIKGKVAKYKTVHAGNKVEMDKDYPSVFVQDIDLLIVFQERVDCVRYFETGHDVFHLGTNLTTESLPTLRQKYQTLDIQLRKLEDGIDLPTFGIRITKNHDKAGNLVLVYSEAYSD